MAEDDQHEHDDLAATVQSMDRASLVQALLDMHVELQNADRQIEKLDQEEEVREFETQQFIEHHRRMLSQKSAELS